MQLKQFMQDKTTEEAIWTGSRAVLIRESGDTVPCPWSETQSHPTARTAPDENSVPPCQRCPFYDGHERASQGTDGQTPWVGVMCRYTGSDPR